MSDTSQQDTSSQVTALLPQDFASHSVEDKALVTEYLTQLSPLDKRACAIAKDHLETSYNILLSNGYHVWLSEATKKRSEATKK